MTNEEFLDYLTEDEKHSLENCELCPRKCHINRIKGGNGFCNTPITPSIALIINHKGEEPAIGGKKGITNVFFSHCNCQCIYCQNYKISNNQTEIKTSYVSMSDILDKIELTLQTSENIIGFVSPTHQLPAMKAIIRELRKRNLNPITVYNCGGYENIDEIKKLSSYIDIYLPDYKYSDDYLAEKFSKAPHYSTIAIKTIKEMYNQKGSTLLKIGVVAENGMIIRHLVLPNYLQNSKKALENIADNISTNITISLMSQYNPPFRLAHDELNRKLTENEYKEIENYAFHLGFHKGYFQDLTSSESVLPDFDNNTFLKNE